MAVTGVVCDSRTAINTTENKIFDMCYVERKNAKRGEDILKIFSDRRFQQGP